MKLTVISYKNTVQILAKILLFFFILIGFLVFGKHLLAAISPNYATSQEYYNLYYVGYIQIQPSYNDTKGHAAKGCFFYENTQDTSTYTTGYGKGKSDTSVYSASAKVYDLFSFTAPAAVFNYHFEWVPDDSDFWPASFPDLVQ